MSNLGFVNDVPLPDVTVREGDLDPIDFTLKSNGVVINLTGHSVEMRIIPTRGTEDAVVYSTTTSNLALQDAANGVVRLTPTTTTFLVSKEPYRAYFNITTAGTVRSIPQGGDIWIRVLRRFA